MKLAAVKRAFAGAAALAITLGLTAGPALADDWKTDKSTCAGAYGALADQKDAMTAWAAVLARTNFVTIDWADRKKKVIGGSPIYEASSEPYETNFKMMIMKDRIDGGANGTATVLELSQKCDAALGYSPSFTIPG